MARRPINIQPEEPMFADGDPGDNLQVENIGDDVLIGDPEEELIEDNSQFDENLAEVIDEKELIQKADMLIQDYENDKSARSEWEQRYKEGLKTLDPDGGLEESEDQRASRGLSTVVHPLISEAATQCKSNCRTLSIWWTSENSYCWRTK